MINSRLAALIGLVAPIALGVVGVTSFIIPPVVENAPAAQPAEKVPSYLGVYEGLVEGDTLIQRYIITKDTFRIDMNNGTPFFRKSYEFTYTYLNAKQAASKYETSGYPVLEVDLNSDSDYENTSENQYVPFEFLNYTSISYTVDFNPVIIEKLVMPGLSLKDIVRVADVPNGTYVKDKNSIVIDQYNKHITIEGQTYRYWVVNGYWLRSNQVTVETESELDTYLLVENEKEIKTVINLQDNAIVYNSVTYTLSK